MTKQNTKLIDKVCQLGQTCYCNPTFSEQLSKIFIVSSIILLVITIISYLIYLNRNKIALMLAPYFYYKCNGQIPENENNNNENSE
jgi:hypothetical protein